MICSIYLEAVVLQNGIVLVDLPGMCFLSGPSLLYVRRLILLGFRDVNSARVRVTEKRLYQCDEIFVVAQIGRAVTNQGVEDLLIRQLGRNFNNLRRSQGVAIVCTKSEVCQVTSRSTFSMTEYF